MVWFLYLQFDISLLVLVVDEGGFFKPLLVVLADPIVFSGFYRFFHPLDFVFEFGMSAFEFVDIAFKADVDLLLDV